jgi:hypothetical protein
VCYGRLSKLAGVGGGCEAARPGFRPHSAVHRSLLGIAAPVAVDFLDDL